MKLTEKLFQKNEDIRIRVGYGILGIILFLWVLNMMEYGVYFSPFKNPSPARIIIVSLFWIWIVSGILNAVSVLGWNYLLNRSIHTITFTASVLSVLGMSFNPGLFLVSHSLTDLLLGISMAAFLILECITILKRHGQWERW